MHDPVMTMYTGATFLRLEMITLPDTAPKGAKSAYGNSRTPAVSGDIFEMVSSF